MSTIQIQSPAKYIQGPYEITNLPTYCEAYSDQEVFVLIDSFILKTYGDTIKESFKNSKLTLTLEEFQGECSYNEIRRVEAIAKKGNPGVIVGIGGGKTLDAAKSVAFYLKKPMIIVPTAASTDAPTSAVAVIYTDSGEVEDYLFLPENPNVVLVDTDIIAKAPSRLLVAGIGDALATYYEARACQAAYKPTMTGKFASKASMALAELCLETLLEDGIKAKLSADAGHSSQALMNVVEANTYLSGIGFESGGLAAAHAVHDGFTILPETHEYLHGEKVAFGTIVQLVLENAESEEIEMIIDFCQALDLPTTLAELGVTENIEEKALLVAKESLKEDKTMGNMPFPVTEELIANAILVADQLGQRIML